MSDFEFQPVPEDCPHGVDDGCCKECYQNITQGEAIEIVQEQSAPAVPQDRIMLERVTKALGDLSFECFDVFSTRAPSVGTYNATFGVLEEARATLSTTPPAPQPEAAQDGLREALLELRCALDPDDWMGDVRMIDFIDAALSKNTREKKK